MHENGSETNTAVNRLNAFYSECVGMDLGSAEAGKIHVVGSDRRLRPEEGYGVVFPFLLLLVRDCCVISVRPDLLGRVRAIVKDAPDACALFQGEFSAALKAACCEALPPQLAEGIFSSHRLDHYADREHFRPFTCRDCRRLTMGDWELVEDMNKVSVFGCNAARVQEGMVFGTIVDGKLVARAVPVAMPEATRKHGVIWLGVETLPDYRGRGYAKAVVSGTTEILLSRGLTPAYNCAAPNTASARTARALGYHLYGERLEWRCPAASRP